MDDDANIVDLLAYREHKEPIQSSLEACISQDLIAAIQLLIQRLREKEPI